MAYTLVPLGVSSSQFPAAYLGIGVSHDASDKIGTEILIMEVMKLLHSLACLHPMHIQASLLVSLEISASTSTVKTGVTYRQYHAREIARKMISAARHTSRRRH